VARFVGSPWKCISVSFASVIGLLLACAADRPKLGRMSDWEPDTLTALSPRHDTLTALSSRYDTGSSKLPALSASTDSASRLGHQGIPFGMYHLAITEFRPPFTGMVLNGSDPADVMQVLEAARKAKVRVVLNMFVSPRQVKNPDGSFNLERWKQRIDRFATVDLEPYIADGTLIGNYLLDEPNSRKKWNNEQVPYADIEAAAQHSKRLWPGLPTLVRVDPIFLGKAPFKWVYLDAAWAQYAARRGKVEQYVARNVAAAKRAGLGLVLGLNVLDGGAGASGRRGTKSKYWAMSAEEVLRYGSVLAREPGGCALLLWKYDRTDTSYFAQPDIQAALSQLGRLAADRPRGSCRVR
jgi:hypothetical protein